ncbi:hypothetical protein ON010_g12207 [Phytophthora cinnamomi]|nr:hypothetical protein ON010_g12207 [Phytophthora cinnamomi]
MVLVKSISTSKTALQTILDGGPKAVDEVAGEMKKNKLVFRSADDLPRQVAAPSLDGKEATAGEPQGVWLPRIAYRFEEIESGGVLVSRDAQFMEDVFDGGRRKYASKEVVIGLPDEDDEDATDEETPSESDEDGSEDEAARNEDFEPGSKRHPRTHSEVPEPVNRTGPIRPHVD